MLGGYIFINGFVVSQEEGDQEDETQFEDYDYFVSEGRFCWFVASEEAEEEDVGGQKGHALGLHIREEQTQAEQ